jgi:hypothetical protein
MPTYEPIQTYTVPSLTTSVTLGSGNTLSQAYTHLRIILSDVSSNGPDANIMATFNGITTATHSWHLCGARALSSTPFSSRNTGAVNAYLQSFTAIGSGYSGGLQLDIPRYSTSGIFKTWFSNVRVGPGSATYSGIEELLGLWRNTGAITQIQFTLNSGGNFTVGSTFTVYGIKAGV